MKRLLSVIFLFILILQCSACGFSTVSFDGEWYSASNGDLYKFSDGWILCENKYLTLKSGKKGSGYYKVKGDNAEAFIYGITGTPDTLTKLAITQNNGNYVISNSKSGKILLFKEKHAAEKYISEKKLRYQQEQAKQEEKQLQAYKKRPTLKYDFFTEDVGVYANVALEAIISNYKYNSSEGKYCFDLWYWSDKNNAYVLDEGHYFVPSTAPKTLADTFSNLKDGDKVKIIVNVDRYKSTNHTKCIYAELIKQGSLSDYGIDPNCKSITTATNKFDSGASIASGNTSDIGISYSKDYVDGKTLYMKTTIKNNSSSMYKGDIYVTFYSEDGKQRLGSDTITVNKLMPGQSTYAKIAIDKYDGMPKLVKTFSNTTFINIKTVSTKIDNELTQKATTSVRLNFDIANWYSTIQSIKVYSDNICVVTSTSKQDSTVIASAVYSCCKQHGIASVQVVDSQGNVLAMYP